MRFAESDNGGMFTRHDRGDGDFDLSVEASLLGVRPGVRLPKEITITLSEGKDALFHIGGRMFHPVSRELQYWRYWSCYDYDQAGQPRFINLKVFND
jgi:hypothetical protein